MALPDLKEWRVETLRVTIFGTETFTPAGLNWWKKVTGAEPEAALNRPQAGEYVESGAFLGGQLEVKVAFNRIDWLLNFPFVGMPGAPEVEELFSLLNKFLSSLQAWAVSADIKAARLALGSVAFRTVPSIFDGNKILTQLIPMCNIPENPELSDVFIQVNVPYVSASLDGSKVNFVSKAAVQNRQVFAIGTSGMPQVLNDVALRAEFDLSTPADATTLDLQRFGAFTEEMVSSIRKVLEDGLKI